MEQRRLNSREWISGEMPPGIKYKTAFVMFYKAASIDEELLILVSRVESREEAFRTHFINQSVTSGKLGPRCREAEWAVPLVTSLVPKAEAFRQLYSDEQDIHRIYGYGLYIGGHEGGYAVSYLKSRFGGYSNTLYNKRFQRLHLPNFILKDIQVAHVAMSALCLISLNEVKECSLILDNCISVGGFGVLEIQFVETCVKLANVCTLALVSPAGLHRMSVAEAYEAFILPAKRVSLVWKGGALEDLERLEELLFHVCSEGRDAHLEELCSAGLRLPKEKIYRVLLGATLVPTASGEVLSRVRCFFDIPQADREHVLRLLDEYIALNAWDKQEDYAASVARVSPLLGGGFVNCRYWRIDHVIYQIKM